MFIRSERLFLRPPWAEDSDAILAGIDDIAVARHLAQVPWPYRLDDARGYAARVQSSRFPHFLITRPRTGAIGADGAEIIGATELRDVCGEAMLGFWLARRAWGQGLATEAARAVLELAAVLGHRRVLAAHFIDNAAAARVLEKLGFALTGEIGMAHCPARGADVAAVTRALWLGAAHLDAPDDGGRPGAAGGGTRQAA